MNTITGRVTIKESGVGIPDLLVVVFDVDPNTQPEEVKPVPGPTPTPPPAPPIAQPAAFPQGDRLGSVLTDANGAFTITYADEEFRVRNSDEKRPDLLLMVFAPEEAGQDGNLRPLFVSPAIRQNAGRTEHYLIRLAAQKMEETALAIPTEATFRIGESRSVIHKINQAVTQQAKINEEVKRIAVEQVAAARAKAQKIETEVEGRLIERLTGVPNRLAERFNFVPPGASADTVTFKTINRNIDQVINKQPPVVGYIQVPNDELQRFKDANGNFRGNISAKEIEPYLFGGDTGEQRPISLLRENPIALACKSDSLPGSLRNAIGGGGTPAHDTPPPSGGESAPPTSEPEVPASAADLPKFIGRLVDHMTSPENAIAFDSDKRATADDVRHEVENLSLHTGPADVPALYDFHHLQIAFDHVWQQAIDEGVIDTAKELVRQLIEMGGDPLAALQSAQDPIKALRNEVKNVRVAQDNLTVSGVRLGDPNVAFRRRNGDDFEPGLPDPINGGPPKRPDITPIAVDITATPAQPHQLLDALEQMLGERYKFEVFAPGSINFGLLVTYRQRWEPVTYQVGDLVKTTTLSPKETRKVSTRRTIKKERTVKEMENNLRIRKDEGNETMRDEAEIIQKAQGKTNFSMTAEGSYDLFFSKGESTTTFGKDAETASNEVKKSFREAVLKAAQEYKDERKLEVETRESYDDETTESVEITNPNDELTVTYLFYELHRRFKVSEQIHRLTPVVLVGMEVPNPNRNAIDRLLLAHSWIINRVLLDDKYRAPLKYLCERVVGDELALQEMQQTVKKLREIVEEMKNKLKTIVGQVEKREQTLERALEKRAALVASESTEGMGEKVWEWAMGSGDDEAIEAARLREEAAKDAYEKAVKERESLLDEMRSETAALNAATMAYAKAFAEHANHLLEIAGLRVHVKENMLYYMQAIWSFTFQDHLFFMLHKVKAPALAIKEKKYAVALASEPSASVIPKPGHTVLEVRASVKLQSNLNPDEDFVTLAEAADLDNPLGYKGNYMIFPLKQSNALTDFMMTPYVDSELGLHDPDELGNWTPGDFVKYARCLKKNLTPAEFAAIEDELAEQYKRLLSAPRRAEDEIIVPTGSLYLEALPGSHPILENFKLMHRAIDVKKVQAEVRKMEMENLRYAARLLNNEREDPEIEKKVLISGGEAKVIVPADTE